MRTQSPTDAMFLTAMLWLNIFVALLAWVRP